MKRFSVFAAWRGCLGFSACSSCSRRGSPSGQVEPRTALAANFWHRWHRANRRNDWHHRNVDRHHRHLDVAIARASAAEARSSCPRSVHSTSRSTCRQNGAVFHSSDFGATWTTIDFRALGVGQRPDTFHLRRAHACTEIPSVAESPRCFASTNGARPSSSPAGNATDLLYLEVDPTSTQRPAGGALRHPVFLK